jgi:hypothetical protein
VPAANTFKGLEWQTELSAHLGAKEHFRLLANWSMPPSKQAVGALRRFSSRHANSTTAAGGALCDGVRARDHNPVGYTRRPPTAKEASWGCRPLGSLPGAVLGDQPMTGREKNDRRVPLQLADRMDRHKRWGRVGQTQKPALPCCATRNVRHPAPVTARDRTDVIQSRCHTSEYRIPRCHTFQMSYKTGGRMSCVSIRMPAELIAQTRCGGRPTWWLNIADSPRPARNRTE